MTWTLEQREAVREFLGAVQPSNPAVLISNVEEFMPAHWRQAFEKLFARLAPSPASAPVTLEEFVARGQAAQAAVDVAVAAAAPAKTTRKARKR